MHQGESETGAGSSLVVLRNPVEAIEDVRQRFLGNAHAGIADLNDRLFFVHPALQVDFTA